jgi:SAM-dependent methyltransferase
MFSLMFSLLAHVNENWVMTIDKSKNLPSSVTRMSKQLFLHNIRINGLKAIIYSYGLSASRYAEYASAVGFLSREVGKTEKVLEIGCGHSILPTFWQRLGIEVIALDTNPLALKWQRTKGSKITGRAVEAVLADMRYLPFRHESIMRLSCISTLEHVPSNGDTGCASEIGRVLNVNGISVISVPLTIHRESCCISHLGGDIPPLIQGLLHFCLPAVLRMLRVDRTNCYFERLFSLEDVCKRIVIPSKCKEENHFMLGSGSAAKALHERILPPGSLTVLEYLIARFLQTSRGVIAPGGIIIELRKP